MLIVLFLTSSRSSRPRHATLILRPFHDFFTHCYESSCHVLSRCLLCIHSSFASSLILALTAPLFFLRLLLLFSSFRAVLPSSLCLCMPVARFDGFRRSCSAILIPPFAANGTSLCIPAWSCAPMICRTFSLPDTQVDCTFCWCFGCWAASMPFLLTPHSCDCFFRL